MANSYTQIYIQFIFAVKKRENLIKEVNRESIEKYICGIVKQKKSKPIAVYCNPDHTHLLVGLNPDTSPADLIGAVKSSSSNWINQQSFMKGKFTWQLGYGAFSYGRSQLDVVAKYVLNQKEHHKKRSFREEYLDLLNKFDVDYNEAYLFDWI
ncbi:MAG: IS200/IS605 family transposase [Saprospirales bacterium]|nr:MAG: IS200/IS605 family transposase [Saprospirales bacterium]